MIYEAAGRVGLSRAGLRELTWRQLDDMDYGRKCLAWDLVADLKSFLASCHGVALGADQLNTFRRSMEGEVMGPKVKPSQVSPDGTVNRKDGKER